MRRTKRSRAIMLPLLAILLLPASVVMAEGRLQDDENLLENPGFEGDYVAHDDVGDIKVAPGWEPWCIEESDERQAEGYGVYGSYYWSSESSDPGGTKEGEFAQFIRHTYAQAACGVLQQVEVPENSKLRLSAWIRTFTCQPPEDDPDAGCQQRDDAWMGVQIAIDPEGGEDFFADSVEFTPGLTSTENEWQEVTLEADAPGSSLVTVFLMYHPDFPRQENKVYFDNASLTVIGEASGDSGSSAAPAAASSLTVPFVTPQPPQGDCSIVHTVSAGEVLSSIAVAYYNQGYTDLTVPKIKELNNLSSDIIYVGQKLTVLPPGTASGCASSAPAPAAGEGEGEGESEEEATPTPEPTEVAETTGEICMSLFDDANGNTLRDPEELLLSGGSLTLSSGSGVLENYTTDGATEPHCFAELTPGEYVAAATAPLGYEMTTVSSWSVQVDSGANLDLTFGALGTGEVPTTEDEGTDGEGGGGLFSNFGRILIGLSGLLVLAIAGGLGAYFLIFRRST